jgi:hypothetical protein
VCLRSKNFTDPSSPPDIKKSLETQSIANNYFWPGFSFIAGCGDFRSHIKIVPSVEAEAKVSTTGLIFSGTDK